MFGLNDYRFPFGRSIAGIPLVAGDFDESKHPRDEKGRFGEGDGAPDKEADRKKEIGKELDRRHDQIQHERSGNKEAAAKEAAKVKTDSSKASKTVAALKRETPIGEAAKAAGVSNAAMQDELRNQAAAGKVQLTRHTGPIENLKDPNSAIIGPGGHIYIAAKGGIGDKIEGLDKFSKGSGEVDRAKLKDNIAVSVKEWKEKNYTDMPVHEMWAKAEASNPNVRLGQFHESLRELHDKGTIRLSSYSGPLANMPQPVLSLLIGHRVQYYARPG